MGTNCANARCWRRFDGVYALCCTACASRHELLRAELGRVGLHDVTDVWQSPIPSDQAFADSCGSGQLRRRLSAFSCTFGHYRIMRAAYDLGLSSILIIEDDARMLLDVGLLWRIADSLPDDYACAKFEWISNVYERDKYVEQFAASSAVSRYWADNGGVIRTAGTAMIAFSRDGMRRKLAMMEDDMAHRGLRPSDGYESDPAFYDGGLRCYLSLPVAAVQGLGADLIHVSHPDFLHCGSVHSYGVDSPEVMHGEPQCAASFCRHSGSGQEAGSAVSVDVVLPATYDDAVKSLSSICTTARFLHASSLTYVVPSQDVERVRSCDAFKAVAPDVWIQVADERDYVDTDLVRGLIREADRNAERRAGWYVQQFVKLAAAFRGKGFILAWDADTFPCAPVELFDRASGRPVFRMKTERHAPYFDCISRLFGGMARATDMSFISEGMLFDCTLVREMVGEHGDFGAFVRAAISSVTPGELGRSGFSEYETYGTWVSHRHPGAYVRHRWTSLRQRPSSFSADMLSPDVLGWLKRGGFDAISVEDSGRGLSGKSPRGDGTTWLTDRNTVRRYWVMEAARRADDGTFDETAYWTFNNGRTANQLYYVLQMLRKGENNLYATKYLSALRELESLGLGGLAVGPEYRSHRACRRGGGNMQGFGNDFTRDDVRTLVRDFIMRSELYHSISSEYGLDCDDVAIHVRNTDYLRPYGGNLFAAFDRASYVREALAWHAERSPGKARSLYVFSDDPGVTRGLFDEEFSRVFPSVVYVPRGDACHDLVRLSLFRRKILANSTYSVWSSFIGDTAFADGTLSTIPSVFYVKCGDDGDVVPIRNIADPSWTVLPVTVSSGRYSGTKFDGKEQL